MKNERRLGMAFAGLLALGGCGDPITQINSLDCGEKRNLLVATISVPETQVVEVGEFGAGIIANKEMGPQIVWLGRPSQPDAVVPLNRERTILAGVYPSEDNALEFKQVTLYANQSPSTVTAKAVCEKVFIAQSFKLENAS